MHCKEWLSNFLNKSLILQIKEESKYSIISFALSLLVNLLHLVDEPLKFAFRQLFLLDGLSGHIGTDCPVPLRNLRIQIA